MGKQGQALVGFRSTPIYEPERSAPEPADAEAETRRWEFKLPALPLPSLSRAAREERAEEREREREAALIETGRQAFFATPAGRARLAYKRGHRLFQYELDVNELPPTVIPGPVGEPGRITTDPVDILNSVTVEGWKLVTGKFIHSEIRGRAVGCYLFKRSQKRRLQLNDPWKLPAKAPTEIDSI